MRHLGRVFRPSVLIAVSAVLVGAAALIALSPTRNAGRPRPGPLAAGEQEVAFLYPAAAATAWGRFVDAVEYVVARLQATHPGLVVERVTRGGDNVDSSAVPEVVLQWPDGTRLVFRWYKLTADWQPADWAEALLAPSGREPPVAVIGGNTSEWGRKVALALAEASGRAGNRPLFLMTTATADEVRSPDAPDDENGFVPMSSLYPGRTFRFGFSNEQMAGGTTRFVWSRLDLRPEGDPAVLVQWTDDAYSVDLMRGYLARLRSRGRQSEADAAAGALAGLTGAVALGGPPASALVPPLTQFRFDYALSFRVDSSIGPFAAPNRPEAQVIDELLTHLAADGLPRRALLVLTGQTQPVRHYLRDLARSAPEVTRRFVVIVGDAVAFNTVYRDREVTWPVQDLPFPLVMFCHRDPVNEGAGFRPIGQGADAGAASGTEDLLLYADVVEAVATALPRDRGAEPQSDRLARGLGELRLSEGRLAPGGPGVPLFGRDGKRRSGTGEHVALLRPHTRGDRVLPRATLEVWRRGEDRDWQRGKDLRVAYDDTRDSRDWLDHGK